MTGNDSSRIGQTEAARVVDARYKVRRDAAPLTWKRPSRERREEPKNTGVKCKCGATSSQFTTRRAFKEHQEVCTA